MPSKFDSIRPYNDTDLPHVLKKLVNNNEFIISLVAFKFSSWPKFSYPLLAWLTRRYIHTQVARVSTLREFQHMVEPYMQRMIETTTESYTVSGIENLDLSNACLFISNHRDIALDPAFVNWALHESGQDTVRIAVGDNLLHKDWVADLIRLNKCFIVKRSATDRREKLAAAKLLSEYIEFTLNTESQHIWIAQKEGRAKDGNDQTNPAIISMLSLNKPKAMAFSEYIKNLRIVPVSISYEFDPCDIAKANELQKLEQEGSYDKPDNEDMRSIMNGITGKKGRVHLHFGEMLTTDFENAKQVAEHIDKAILSEYKSFSTGPCAAQMLDPNLDIEPQEQAKQYLLQRVEGLVDAERDKLLAMYARPYLKQQGQDL